MQRMGRSVFDGARRRHQGLADNVPTKHALAFRLRRASAKEIVF